MTHPDRGLDPSWKRLSSFECPWLAGDRPGKPMRQRTGPRTGRGRGPSLTPDPPPPGVRPLPSAPRSDDAVKDCVLRLGARCNSILGIDESRRVPAIVMPRKRYLKTRHFLQGTPDNRRLWESSNLPDGISCGYRSLPTTL